MRPTEVSSCFTILRLPSPTLRTRQTDPCAPPASVWLGAIPSHKLSVVRSASLVRSQPSSVPSNRVIRTPWTRRSCKCRSTSATSAFGRYVAGPGRITCSTEDSASAQSSCTRSSPMRMSCSFSTTHTSQPAASTCCRMSPMRSRKPQRVSHFLALPTRCVECSRMK